MLEISISIFQNKILSYTQNFNFLLEFFSELNAISFR